jgi:hypothetical protein
LNLAKGWRVLGGDGMNASFVVVQSTNSLPKTARSAVATLTEKRASNRKAGWRVGAVKRMTMRKQ